MLRFILLALTLLVVSACYSGEDAARLEQEVTVCNGPPSPGGTYFYNKGLTALPGNVERAHFLVNKMWGTWPKPPTSCTPGVDCNPLTPTTCTMAQCQANQCYSWTCAMTPLYYASDGLRLCTVARGPSYVEDKWDEQPSAGGLTSLETTELAAIRLLASQPDDDYFCHEE